MYVILVEDKGPQVLIPVVLNGLSSLVNERHGKHVVKSALLTPLSNGHLLED